MEIDDSPLFGESFHLADGQDTRIPHGLQSLRESVFLRPTDEEDVAGLDLLKRLEWQDGQLSSIYHLAFERPESFAKRIISENAHRNDVRVAVEDLGGPVDKPGKVVEKGGLDLILAPCALARAAAPRASPKPANRIK